MACSTVNFYLFFGAFAKFTAATLRFVMSARSAPHWTDFREILYLYIFRKSVEKIKVSLKYGKNNGQLARRPMYIFKIISRSFRLRMPNVSDKNFRES